LFTAQSAPLRFAETLILRIAILEEVLSVLDQQVENVLLQVQEEVIMNVVVHPQGEMLILTDVNKVVPAVEEVETSDLVI
jgi:hypothetical protein